MKVNFVELSKQYANIKDDVLRDLDEIISTGAFLGSQEFEEKFAAFHGRNFCVGVGSGTDALWLSLVALGIGPGDEVLVPANTYIATAFAVSHAGATPVFVDPDPETYVMTTDSLLEALTPKTKAIVPVHLYGQPANMIELLHFAERHSIFVVEDCAQSAGASYMDKKTGAWGDVGCYSFYPTKNLGGLGQGGAVVTDNEDLAVAVRELGNVGRAEGSWFDYAHKGFNSRLDAVNSVFLSRCLDKLEDWNKARAFAATMYSDALVDVDVITPPLPNAIMNPVYHLYELKCSSESIRDGLKDFLSEKEIGCGLHYPVPCHRQEVYSLEFRECPISDELSKTLLSLPMHPLLRPVDVEFVCRSIKEFFNKQTT